jgi:hypothetical protein
MKIDITKIKNSTKLTFTFFVTAIFLSVFFVSYSVSVKNDFLMKELELKITENIDIKIHKVEDLLDNQEKEYRKVYDEELFVRFLKLSHEDEKYDETLEETFNLFDSSTFFGVGLSDSEGFIVSTDRREFIGMDFSDTLVTKKILAEGEAYSIYPELEPSEVGLAYGKIINDPETGEFLGSWGVRFPLNRLKKIIGEEDSLGKTAESYLISDDFLLLTPSRFLHGENKGVLVQVVNTENSKNCFDKDFEGHAFKHEPVILIPFLDYRGEEVLGTHREVFRTNWCLLVEVEKSDSINSPLVKYAIKQIVFSVFFIIIFTLLGSLIGRYLNLNTNRKK